MDSPRILAANLNPFIPFSFYFSPFMMGESSFPRGMNESPPCFLASLFEPLNQILSPQQLLILPAPQHSQFSLEFWFWILLCWAWISKGGAAPLPFFLGNDVRKSSFFPGEKGMCLVPPVLLNLFFIIWRTSKKFSLFPNPEAKIQIYPRFGGFLSQIIGSGGYFGRTSDIWFLMLEDSDPPAWKSKTP